MQCSNSIPIHIHMHTCDIHTDGILRNEIPFIIIINSSRLGFISWRKNKLFNNVTVAFHALCILLNDSYSPLLDMYPCVRGSDTSRRGVF